MKRKVFRELSIDKVWLPLIVTLLDGHNTAMAISKNDNEQYCKTLALMHDVLVSVYVDTKIMNIDDFNRTFLLFVYTMEYIYGNPKNEKKETVKSVNIYDVFEHIRKNWYINVSEAIEKYE